ncbi:MAG: hypothetical protein HOV83_20950 [Catenulispora sp.]|nr:hypothetical protein [Catenulispora sp.]
MRRKALMRSRSGTAACLVTATATLLAGLTAVTQPAQAASAGTVTIGSNLCLDDLNGGTADGTTVQLLGCDGSGKQNWTWNGDGTLTVFGKCAEITNGSNANGALLQLASCASGAIRQQFSWLPDHTIYAAKSGKCLAVQGSVAANAKIGLASCDPSKTAEVWKANSAPAAKYTLTTSAATSFANIDDTPDAPYIDKDGTFYYQSSHSLYGATDSRKWTFYSGTNFDSVTKASASNQTANADTTSRCNNSPTGTNATSSSGYPERNYCDLAGVWVDPDTGDWYGLVHNEFTGQPFGDGLHFDAIDYAKSTDQGNTWTIKGHAITSPYSTTRNDTNAFPNQTYYYGDGDQRLFVDYASGYFYAFYATRVVTKSGSGGNVWLQHVARAPISGKMATGSWQKWYNGAWNQAGVGGSESDIIPADGSGLGYVQPSLDYSPSTTGSAATQVANGTMPDQSQLAVMNVAWDAYLGKYIGTPQNNVAQNTNTKTPLHFYATDDLATQKWTDMGLAGDDNASWYRWMLDSANKTSSTVVGKTFRSYCAYYCSGSNSGEYVSVTITPSSSGSLPTPPVTAGTAYQVKAANGDYLVQNASSLTTSTTSSASASQSWKFTATGDGFYTIANANSGQVLGVDSSSNAGRAFDAPVSLSTLGSTATVGQQWSIQTGLNTPAASGASTPSGAYRLVNRYSGQALSLTSGTSAIATAPQRGWDNTGTAADTRPADAQSLTFSAGTTGTTVDLALNKTTTASSVEPGTSFTAGLATDGDGTTRWSSAASDPQWLQVDLGSTHSITEVELAWEAAYGKSFQIQVSNDASNWTNIYSTTSGTGGNQDLTGLSGSGRYIRMYGTARGTGYGYSLWSFNVYGS